MLVTERGHAGETGVGCFCLHTRITTYDISSLFGFAFLCYQTDLTLGLPQVEGLHDSAEDRVFLQLRFDGEEGATLRTAVGVLPGGEKTVLAEVVAAWDGDRTVKGTQTDAAGQFILQTHQRKLSRVHFGHDETSDEAALVLEYSREDESHQLDYVQRPNDEMLTDLI